jgi:hypothetical protein
MIFPWKKFHVILFEEISTTPPPVGRCSKPAREKEGERERE